MKKTIGFIIALFATFIAISTTSKAADVSTWDELKAAIAGNDEVVTLTENITGETQILEIPTSRKVELNLNGKTLTVKHAIKVDGDIKITGNGTITSTTYIRPIYMFPGGKVELESGKIDVSGLTQATGIALEGATTDNGVKTEVIVGKEATITADYAVAILANSYGIKVDISGTLIGKGQHQDSTSIYINGNLKATTGNVPQINIYESATVKSINNGPAVYAAGFAKWNIYGGTIEGTEALSIKAGEFNITGGTLKANGPFISAPEAATNHSEPTGSAISITSNDAYARNIKVNISNATVTSEKGYALLETITRGTGTGGTHIEITSGNFTGKEGALYSDNIENFVKGGSYDGEVDIKYISNTLEKVEENGVTYVGTKNEIVIPEVENGKVTSSIGEAVKGQKVTLTVVSNEGYKVNAVQVFDDNNNEIIVTDGSFVMPDSKVTVKVKFVKITTKPSEEPSKETDNQGETDEKDETPKTGVMDFTVYAILTATMAIAGIAVTRKIKT